MDNENKEMKLHVQSVPDKSLLIGARESAAESHIRYLRRLAEEKLLLQQRLSKTLNEMTHILLRRHGEIVLAEPSRDERTRELEINEKLLDIINAFFEGE